MKKMAIFNFTKDLILAAICYGFGVILIPALGLGPGAEGLITPVFFAGIPFGWRWASKLITAVSLKGVGIKLVISAAIGWVAVWVILAFDLIHCFIAPSGQVEG